MKKKIVFFVESMHCGGAEKSLLSLLTNLDSKKYEVDLLVTRKGGEFEQFIPKWVNYKSVNPKLGIIGRIKFKFLTKMYPDVHKAQLFWKSFQSQIQRYPEKYDVAVGWGQGFATYFTAEKIKATKKYAWVNTDYEKAGYKPKYDTKIYKIFDKIIGISEFVKTSMQKVIAEDKVIQIKNIIDTDEVIVKANSFDITDFENNKFTIVSVGRLAKPKAFDLSIKAANVLHEKNIDFKWYIIGEGTERNYLESLIQDYNLADKVELLGFRDNPYPYIKKCDVYVQTSLFEGLGRTLIEASILHKPVVVTNFPTAYSIFENNETGIITKMEASEIANAIELLQTDEKFRSKIIQNLKNQSNSDKEETLSKVYQLFDSL